MASIKEKLDSVGGFSIDKTVVVDEDRNGKDFNTLEIRNRHFSDSKIHTFILRGTNTAVLGLDDVGTQITISPNTVNFITGNILGVNPQGVVYTSKIESTVHANAAGVVTCLSSMTTVIKDDVPTGQTWSIVPIGSLNRFSYSTTRAGTTNVIKWVVCTQVIAIEWQ